MTEEKYEHLKRITALVNKRIEEKYVKGNTEHGGDIHELDTLKEALDEAIDLVVYIQTEIEKRSQT